MTALPPKPTHGFDPLRFCPPKLSRAQERQKLVAEAAYYRALKRGFATGHEHEDWLAAEAEVTGSIECEYVLI